MTTLTTRLSQATEPTREMLWEAWQGVMMQDLGGGDENSQRSLYSHQCRYLALLDAEAWASAVEMLVPEGWEWALYGPTDGFRAQAQLETSAMRAKPDFEPVSAFGEHIALALAIACLKARGLS